MSHSSFQSFSDSLFNSSNPRFSSLSDEELLHQINQHNANRSALNLKTIHANLIKPRHTTTPTPSQNQNENESQTQPPAPLKEEIVNETAGEDQSPSLAVPHPLISVDINAPLTGEEEENEATDQIVELKNSSDDKTIDQSQQQEIDQFDSDSLSTNSSDPSPSESASLPPLSVSVDSAVSLPSHVVSQSDASTIGLNSLLRNSVRRYSVLASAINSTSATHDASLAAISQSAASPPESFTISASISAVKPPSKDGSTSPVAALSAVDRAAADPESVDWQGLLTKPPDSRTTEDVDLIFTYIKHMKIAFLKQLAPELVHQLCKHFVLEVYDKAENVFEQGDIGMHFYIIISGSVGIHIREEEEELMNEVEEPSAGKQLSRNSSQENISNDINSPPHLERTISNNSHSKRANQTPAHGNNPLSSHNQPTEHFNFPQSNTQSDWLQKAKKEKKRAELIKATQEIMTLQSGSAFGEVALLQPKNRRTATITCKERTFLLSLGKAHYLSALKEKISLERNKKLAFIQSNPLFKRLSHEKQTSLAIQLQQRCVGRNTVLIRENELIERDTENAPVLIFVASGELIVKKEVRPEVLNFNNSKSANDSGDELEEENGKSKKLSKRKKLHRALADELAQSAALSAEDYASLSRLGDLDSNFSQQIELSRIGENGYIGEESILLENEVVYHSTVVASVSSVLYTLSSHNFHRFIRGSALTQVIEICRQRESLRAERVRAIIKDYLTAKQNSSATSASQHWSNEFNHDELISQHLSYSAPPSVFHKKPTSPKRFAINSLQSGMVQININRKLRKAENLKFQNNGSRPQTANGRIKEAATRQEIEGEEAKFSIDSEIAHALMGVGARHHRESHLASLTSDRIPLSALSALKPLPDIPMRPQTAKKPTNSRPIKENHSNSMQRARRNSQLSLLLGVGTGLGMHAVQDSETGEIFKMGKSEAEIEEFKGEQAAIQRAPSRSYLASPVNKFSVNDRPLAAIFSRTGHSRKAGMRDFQLEIPLEIARKVNPFRPVPPDHTVESWENYAKKTSAVNKTENSQGGDKNRRPSGILARNHLSSYTETEGIQSSRQLNSQTPLIPHVVPFTVGSISALDNPMKKSRNAPRSHTAHQLIAQQMTKKLREFHQFA